MGKSKKSGKLKANLDQGASENEVTDAPAQVEIPFDVAHSKRTLWAGDLLIWGTPPAGSHASTRPHTM